MKAATLILISLFLTTITFASEINTQSDDASLTEVMSANSQCLIVDGDDIEKFEIGTRYLVTCETDPNTKENISVKYCFKNDKGDAEWSPVHDEFNPDGC